MAASPAADDTLVLVLHLQLMRRQLPPLAAFDASAAL
jgi:hypothetical protein